MSKLVKKAFAIATAMLSLGLFASASNDDVIKVTDANVGDNWSSIKGSPTVVIPAGATNTSEKAEWTAATLPNVGIGEAITNALQITAFAPSGYKTPADLKNGVTAKVTVYPSGDSKAVGSWQYAWTTNDFERWPDSKVPDSRFEKDVSIVLDPEWFNACVRTNATEQGFHKDYLDLQFDIAWNGKTVERTWSVRLYADGVVLDSGRDRNFRGFPERFPVEYDLTNDYPVVRPWLATPVKPEFAWQPGVTDFTILETRDITLPTNLTDTADAKFLGWKSVPASKLGKAETIERAEFKDEIVADFGKGDFKVTYQAEWAPYRWFVITNAVDGAAVTNRFVNYSEAYASITNGCIVGATLSPNTAFAAPRKVSLDYPVVMDVPRYVFEAVTNLTLDLAGTVVTNTPKGAASNDHPLFLMNYCSNLTVRSGLLDVANDTMGAFFVDNDSTVTVGEGVLATNRLSGVRSPSYGVFVGDRSAVTLAGGCIDAKTPVKTWGSGVIGPDDVGTRFSVATTNSWLNRMGQFITATNVVPYAYFDTVGYPYGFKELGPAPVTVGSFLTTNASEFVFSFDGLVVTNSTKGVWCLPLAIRVPDGVQTDYNGYSMRLVRDFGTYATTNTLDEAGIVKGDYITTVFPLTRDEFYAAAEGGYTLTNRVCVSWDGQANGRKTDVTLVFDPLTFTLWDDATGKREWPRDTQATLADQLGGEIAAGAGYSWQTNGVPSWNGRVMQSAVLGFNDLDVITNGWQGTGFFRVYDLADNFQKGRIFGGWDSAYLANVGGTNYIDRAKFTKDIVITSKWDNAWWYVKDTNGVPCAVAKTAEEAFKAAYELCPTNATVVLNTGHEFGDVCTDKFYIALKNGATLDLNGGICTNMGYGIACKDGTNTVCGGTYVDRNYFSVVDTLVLSNLRADFNGGAFETGILFSYPSIGNGDRCLIVPADSSVVVDASDSATLFQVMTTNVVMNLKGGCFNVGQAGDKPPAARFVNFVGNGETIDPYAVFTADTTGARFDAPTTNAWTAANGTFLTAPGVVPYCYDDKLGYPYGYAELGTNTVVSYAGQAFTNALEDTTVVMVSNVVMKARKATKGLHAGETGYFAEVTVQAPSGYQRDYNGRVPGKITVSFWEGGDKTKKLLVADIPDVSEDGLMTLNVPVTHDELRKYALEDTMCFYYYTFRWDGQANGRKNTVRVVIDPKSVTLVAEDGENDWPRDFQIKAVNTLDTPGWSTNGYGTVTAPMTTNVLYYTELDAITNKTGIGCYRVYDLADRYGADDGHGGKVNYKFVGWDVDETVIVKDEKTGYSYLPANIASNVQLKAKWDLAPWTLLAADGSTNGIYAALAPAFARAASNETVRLDAPVWEATATSTLASAYPVTIDLNGGTVLAPLSAKLMYSVLRFDGPGKVLLKNGNVINETSLAAAAVSASYYDVTFADVNVFGFRQINANGGDFAMTNVTCAAPAGQIPTSQFHAVMFTACDSVSLADVTVGQSDDWANGGEVSFASCGSVSVKDTGVFARAYENALVADNCLDVTVSGGKFQSYYADALWSSGSSLAVAGNAEIETFGVASGIAFYGDVTAASTNLLTVGCASIRSEGNGINFNGGKIVTLPGSGLVALTQGDTVVVENGVDGIEVDPANVCLWGGDFEVGDFMEISDGTESAERYLADFERSEVTDFRRALVSVASDPLLPLQKFLTVKPGCGPAAFSTIVDESYAADGYHTADNGRVYPDTWFYVVANTYAITYDADGGSINEPTVSSYAVTNSVTLPVNVTKAAYSFGGWTNDVLGLVKEIPVGTTGNLEFKAIWSENDYTVYVDYQGADGYPKYVRYFNEDTLQYYWLPSKRYAYPNYATGTDKGVVITPSQGVTLEAPAYKGFEFLYFEDVDNATRYFANREYGILDFKFDDDSKVHLRAVWAGSMGVVDGEGNRYVTLQDAIASSLTKPGSVLRVVGNGEAFEVTSPVIVDKDITVDLNGKLLKIGEGFEGDTLVIVTNAPNALVCNGSLDGSAETNAIVTIDAAAKSVKSIDSSWLLRYAVEVPADYIVTGYACVKSGDWYEVAATSHTLSFTAGNLGIRADLVPALNNEPVSFTCDDAPIVLNDATRVGYVFDGWWYDDLTKVEGGVFNPAGFVEDVVLMAKWTPASYAISYETVEGEIAGEKTSYTCEDEAFTLVTPVRPGFTFTGWRVNGAEPVDPCVLAPRTWTAFEPLMAVATWQADCYVITFDVAGGKPISDLRYNAQLCDQGYVEIPAPEKVGSKFVKWVDEKGHEVAVGKVTKCFDANLTAVWERSLWSGDNTVVGGNPADGRGAAFNGNVTYAGWLQAADGTLAGKVAVTAGKPTAQGVCTVTLTAGPVLGEGATYTLKNAAVKVTGEVLKGVVLSGKSGSATVTISDNGVSGTFGDYAIVASADRFAMNVTKIPAAALAYLQGNWTVAFQSTNHCHGATTLKLAVAAKGKVTVTGNLGDGTAVSTTSQLVYGDGVCVCPVVVNAYKGKAGGFAFNLWFGTTGAGDALADETEVTALSDLVDADGDVLCEAADVRALVSRVAENAALEDYVFQVALDEFDLPDGYELVAGDQSVEVEANPATGKLTLPKASTVKVDAATGVATWKNQAGNDLGLALTYTPKTGALAGSLKVYAKTQNARTGKWSLKTYQVKVYGVMTGKVAFCAAVEKTLGSAPAELVGEAD